jgi:DNA polymerase-1
VIVPDRNDFDPLLDAYLATGDCARRAAIDCPPGLVLAIDTETPSVSDPFTIKCLTAAWTHEGTTQAVLLDPARCDNDALIARELIARASEIVLHNAPFDMPGLFHAGLIDDAGIARVTDTLIYARMAVPDSHTPKKLEALASRYLGLRDFAEGMKVAFKARGYATLAAGFAGMDIDSPSYRFGAMADTIVTLHVLPLVREHAIARTLDHPFTSYGLTDRSDAETLVAREQRVNRVMLRRNAHGLAVDLDYLERYREQVEESYIGAQAAFDSAGLVPGVPGALVAALHERGELPPAWPRTPTGKLKATKDVLDQLEHPLAVAQRAISHTDKLLGYLDKVRVHAHRTGRLHPQCAILGASATGRMSYNSPELQQFPPEARGIVIDDGQGLTSIDWSQIEPVTLANMAHDVEFLAPFEAGADLYEPIERAAGVPRKVAKIVLLATMYGQGVSSLAATIGATQDSALQIKRQMLAAMPKSSRLMGRIQAVAQQHGLALTVSGRVLTLPSNKGEIMAHKSVNYTVQGSALDILHEAIVALDDVGLGEHVQLALHDELVVDTGAAAEIERIMQRPPDRLCWWAQRKPVLRTDRADLGHAWKAV